VKIKPPPKSKKTQKARKVKVKASIQEPPYLIPASQLAPNHSGLGFINHVPEMTESQVIDDTDNNMLLSVDF